MHIEHTGTDDYRNTGTGIIYWFQIDGNIYGLCCDEIGDTRRPELDSWLDCDGSPLAYPNEHIHPADQRVAVRMILDAHA